MSWDYIERRNAKLRQKLGPSPSPVSPFTVPKQLRGDKGEDDNKNKVPGHSDDTLNKPSSIAEDAALEAIAAKAAEEEVARFMRDAPTPTPSSPRSVPTMRIGSPLLEAARQGGYTGGGCGGHGGTSSGGGRSAGGRSGGTGSGGGRSAGGGSGGGESGGGIGRRKEVRWSRDVDYEG